MGQVTRTGLMVVLHHGREEVRIPAKKLADEAPIYHREEKRPAYLDRLKPVAVKDLPPTGDLNAAFLKLLDSPSIASKEWVYEQYDHMVGTNTVLLPGSDAAVIRIKGTKKHLAVSTDCNSTYCYLDPYEGGKIAVAEAARNVVCSGALPLSITNCLNFGNPMKPEVFWQFRKCVEGMSEACRKFDTPVSGGNVSFYNESPDGSVDPTPTVGMVGLIEGRQPVPSAFREDGDVIFAVGETREELGGSEFLKVIHGKKEGFPPRLDLDEAARFNALILDAAGAGILKSAHDLSEGGLAVALAECCIVDREHMRGAEILLPQGSVSNEAFLFGETQSRAVVSVPPAKASAFEALAKKHGVPVALAGRVGGKTLKINDKINVPLVVLAETWRKSIVRRMQPSD